MAPRATGPSPDGTRQASWTAPTTRTQQHLPIPAAVAPASQSSAPAPSASPSPTRSSARSAAAADRAGLAKGAFAAQATLIIARSGTTPSDSPLREALGEFIRAAGLVRRIGVNLNQAVAKLNATGQRSGDLLPYAAESLRRAQLLDQAAEEVRKRIRQ